MKEEMMFKYAQIRNSYARKRFGTLTNEEKALIDYETFCLELIKENENLQSQLKAKEEELKYTIPIVEHNKIVSKKLKENKKYKEAINKAINNSQHWIDYYTRLNSDERIALRLQENIDILNEVK
jgi:hypothetical protein